MKKPTIIAILGLLIFNLSFAQNQEKYAKLISEAENLYDAKDYRQSAEKYSDAFVAMGNKAIPNDRYNAACSWALAKEIDSSFVQLFRLAKNGNLTRYESISTDTDLDILHSDDRWGKFLEKVKENKEKAEAKLDRPLMAILDTIDQDDQGLRIQLSEVEEKYGRNSEEMTAHWKKIAEKDSINLIKIEKILNERGWLGSDIIGDEGNSTLFLVIQHANLNVQEKYLPMMRKAVTNGNARASSLALLEDRVALREGKRQIYGSQIGRNVETGAFYVSPLQDPDNVDQRRAEVGLGTLQEYLNNWNITWDVEKYKRELPELEKIQD